MTGRGRRRLLLLLRLPCGIGAPDRLPAILRGNVGRRAGAILRFLDQLGDELGAGNTLSPGASIEGVSAEAELHRGED
jgi:hypothetical protein